MNPMVLPFGKRTMTKFEPPDTAELAHWVVCCYGGKTEIERHNWVDQLDPHRTLICSKCDTKIELMRISTRKE